MDELEALRQEYAKELPGRMAEIQRLWEDIKAVENAELLQQFQHQVHKLAGSGAVYGFIKLSDAAHELDTLLLHHTRSGVALNGEGHSRVSELLSQMRQALKI
ncbi:MAG: Hpt domain-containing protein [Deltaproteobacteria bacterium]|nr:Hpt domain-containing protein [Deltaproteobacteria bacterium]